MRWHSPPSLALLSLALLSGTSAAAATTTAASSNQWPSSASWPLCKPGLPGSPCDQDVRGNPRRPSSHRSFTEPNAASPLGGLHVIDRNVTEGGGDLVRPAGGQSRTWTAHHH